MFGSKKREVVEHVQEKFVPHVKITRLSRTLWKIKVVADENSFYGPDIYHRRGTEKRINRFAMRKLRKAVQLHEWQSTTKRLDVK